MLWSHYPHGILLTLATLAAWFVCGIAWRRRHAHGGRWLFLLVLAVAIWNSGAALEELAQSLPVKLLLSQVQQIGKTTSPPIFFLYALSFARRPVTQRPLAAGLAIVPAALISLTFSNQVHGLIWSDAYLHPQSGHIVLTPGPLDWLGVLYAYILIGLSGLVLLNAAITLRHIYRRQALVLLVAMLPPVIGNFITLSNTQSMGVDLTPFGFSLSALLLVYSMRANHMTELVPVARGLMLDVMEDGMLVVDGKGRIVDLNRAATAILGISDAEAAVGRRLMDLPGPGAVWAGLARGERSGGELALETPAGECYYDVAATQLSSRKGETTGLLLVLRNITPRRRALEALETANSRLRSEVAAHERLIADLDAFGHTVAHDLKSPLSQMAGAADLLAGEHVTLDPESQRQMAAMIRSGAFKAARIVDELLLLAGTRRQDLVLEPLAMDEVVNSVLTRLQMEIQDAAATIHLPEQWPSALGNPIWVEEVWWNLLSNGIKYGGTPPRLTLGAEILADRVRYWVTDNGDGLSPEQQATLFSAQVRLQAARCQGHGLGLTIARNIVEKLGGELDVDSPGVAGAGATFAFTLRPATSEQSADEAPLLAG